MAKHDVLDGEITTGLVLHLDPDELLEGGATYSCDAELRVRGGHFFVCVGIEHRRKLGRWLPVFSEPGPLRVELATDRKTGHEKWTANPTYFHPEQVWEIPNKAIPIAARKGEDASFQGNRSRVKNATALLEPAAPTPSPATKRPDPVG